MTLDLFPSLMEAVSFLSWYVQLSHVFMTVSSQVVFLLYRFGFIESTLGPALFLADGLASGFGV